MASNGQIQRPQTTGIGPPAQLLRTLQRHDSQIYRALDSLSALQGKSFLDQATAESLYGASVLRDALELGGKAQLSVQGLRGILVQPQTAAAKRVTALPSANTDPLRQDGTLVLFNGVLYAFNGIPAPGMWIAAAALGVALEDSHANRIANFPPANYPVGVIFRETDRNVVYVNFGGFWVFAAGAMMNVFASRPTDLGVHDVGFLFFASDTLAISQWNGTAWISFTGGATPSTLTERTVTASTTIGALDYTIFADATAGPLTVNYDPAPLSGRVLNVKKIDSTLNAVTHDGNGHNIEGGATVVVTTPGLSLQTQYRSAGAEWRVI